MKPILLNTAAQMAEAIVRVEQAGEGFRLPVIRAAAEGVIAAVAVTHGAPVRAAYLGLGKPTIISICDDHPGATGPGRWKQVRRLLRWSRIAILHASGGHPLHYEMAVACALQLERVLLIEMQQQHHAAWLALAERYVPRLKILNIVPPPGDCHPRRHAPAGEVVH